MQLPGGDPLGPAPRKALVVVGVVEVDPLLPLGPDQADVAAVDDDHVVAGVDCGVVDRLVLPLQDRGDPLG